MITEVAIESKTKNAKYAKLFNERASAWLETLHKFSDEALQQQPTKDSWSLSLLYDHVIKVAYTYQLMHANEAAENSAESKGSKNAFGLLLLGLNFLPRTTIKMEKFPEDLVQKFTPESKSKTEIIQAFSAFIETVNTHFRTLAKGNLKSKYKHPMFGNLNAIEWLRLVEIHMKHHERQKTKIIKTLKL